MNRRSMRNSSRRGKAAKRSQRRVSKRSQRRSQRRSNRRSNRRKVKDKSIIGEFLGAIETGAEELLDDVNRGARGLIRGSKRAIKGSLKNVSRAARGSIRGVERGLSRGVDGVGRVGTGVVRGVRALERGKPFSAVRKVSRGVERGSRRAALGVIDGFEDVVESGIHGVAGVGRSVVRGVDTPIRAVLNKKRSGRKSTRKSGKKGKSAYNLFMKKELAKLKKEYPNMEQSDRFKEAARRWKSSKR
jgi:hypothetical protein